MVTVNAEYSQHEKQYLWIWQVCGLKGHPNIISCNLLAALLPLGCRYWTTKKDVPLSILGPTAYHTTFLEVGWSQALSYLLGTTVVPGNPSRKLITSVALVGTIGLWEFMRRVSNPACFCRRALSPKSQERWRFSGNRPDATDRIKDRTTCRDGGPEILGPAILQCLQFSLFKCYLRDLFQSLVSVPFWGLWRVPLPLQLIDYEVMIPPQSVEPSLLRLIWNLARLWRSQSTRDDQPEFKYGSPWFTRYICIPNL